MEIGQYIKIDQYNYGSVSGNGFQTYHDSLVGISWSQLTC